LSFALIAWTQEGHQACRTSRFSNPRDPLEVPPDLE